MTIAWYPPDQAQVRYLPFSRSGDVQFRPLTRCNWASVTSHLAVAGPALPGKEVVYLHTLWLARARQAGHRRTGWRHDRIIGSVRDNGAKISNRLIREIPALADESLAAEVATAILLALAQMI